MKENLCSKLLLILPFKTIFIATLAMSDTVMVYPLKLNDI